MLEIFLFCLAAYLIAALPLKAIFELSYFQIKSVLKQLDNVSFQVYMSGLTFINLLVLVLTFVKGFGVVYFERVYFESPLILLLGIASVFIGHTYSPFRKFKLQSFFFLILGILTGINIFVGLVFFIAWLLVVAISRSNELAILLALGCSITTPYFLFLSQDYYFSLGFLTLFTFIALSTRLFDYFEGRGTTIFDTFQSR